MMQTSTAIIIGGGVIGLSTAYHLARKRFGRILVLDKGPIGDGSSSRAAGIITGLLWSNTGVLARKRSLALYRQLSEELPGYRFQDVGCLNLFDPLSWPERQALLPLYDQLGAPYEILNAMEIHSRWPALTPEVEITGLYDPLGGYSEPDEYVPALALRSRDLGVEIHEHQPVGGFVEHNGRIAGVRAGDRVIEGDAVICTVHAWLPPVFALVNAQLPVKTFVHQRYVTTPFPAPVAIPAVNANPQGGYLRPAAGQRVLAGAETAWRSEYYVSSLDFHMSALSAPLQVKDELAANMTPLMPCLAQSAWQSEKVGLIAFSMDGEPVLGPVDGLPGLYVGCGFHSGGFAYNPVAGELLADFVADGRTSIDVRAFSPNRFTADGTEEYLATTVAQAEAVRRRH
jgi:glycine/D-amino acid oxidase-like deaminating enzyme